MVSGRLLLRLRRASDHRLPLPMRRFDQIRNPYQVGNGAHNRVVCRTFGQQVFVFEVGKAAHVLGVS